MARKDAPIDDEKRSYGALWFVCSLLLFVGALWAVLDDNVFRRPWKKYQAEFARLEIQRLEEQIAAEQARLDADPAYQAATKAVEEARAAVASGENARRLAELRAFRRMLRDHLAACEQALAAAAEPACPTMDALDEPARANGRRSRTRR